LQTAIDVVTPLGKATASPVRRQSFSSAVFLARFGLSLLLRPLLYRISVDNHERRSTLDSRQRTDSTTHVHTQTDSLSSPASVCTRPPLQTCPLPPPGTFTTFNSSVTASRLCSHPVIYWFNGCFIVCSFLIVLPINHRHRRHQKAIIFNIIFTIIVIFYLV